MPKTEVDITSVSEALGLARWALECSLADEKQFFVGESPHSEAEWFISSLANLLQILERGSVDLEASLKSDPESVFYAFAFHDRMGKSVKDALQKATDTWLLDIGMAMATGCRCGFSELPAASTVLPAKDEVQGLGVVHLHIPWMKDDDEPKGVPGRPTVEVEGEVDPLFIDLLVNDSFDACQLSVDDERTQHEVAWLEPSEDGGEWVVTWLCSSCGKRVPRVFLSSDSAKKFLTRVEQDTTEERRCRKCRKEGRE